jgi:hypothetical protein
MTTPPPPPAFVDLTVQGSSFSSSLIPPTITINGWRVQPGYGRRVLPVAPGPVRVDGEAQWWRTHGQATLTFTAAPGQTVPVFYAAPMNVFTGGSLGHVPQRRRGALATWLMLAGMLAVIAVVTVAVLAAGTP